MPRNLAFRLTKLLKVGELPADFECSWSTTPVLLTAVTVAAHVGRLTALLPQSGRAPRPSDFGDILHTFNLPFVDFFRADGFLASAIADAKLPFNTKVVAKFRDLPAAIEEEISLTSPGDGTA